MVVNLPLPPNGPTHLPPQPNDPPTLTDIANSVVYNQQLLISHRAKLIIRSLDLSPSLTLTEAGVPISATSDDIGRGEIYQAELIQAHAGASE
jgi:hypothetical protein